MLTITDSWKEAYPTASAGILVMRNVANPNDHAALDSQKATLENEIRARYGDLNRAAIKALPTIQAYNAYYRQYKKTYHVQLQLESVALKGKSIPSVAALVEAMFMAELKNLLLTAGHDVEAIHTPLMLDVATGSERYTMLSGREQELKQGDMMFTDDDGVISSVVYGPDSRTRITSDTRRALFAIYAPEGIEQDVVTQHLQDIREYVAIVSPEAEVELLRVYDAKSE